VESQPYNCAHVRGVALLRGGKTREIVAKLGLSVWGRIHVHAWTGSSGSTALFVTIGQTDPHSVRQGSFFWLQNTEGLTHCKVVFLKPCLLAATDTIHYY
jgi:hypothetical protein